MVTLSPGDGPSDTSPPSDSRFSLSTVQPTWEPGLAAAEESPANPDLPHQRCVFWAGDLGRAWCSPCHSLSCLLTDLSHKHFHVVALLM